MISPFDVIEGARVPGRTGLYVLGCYDSRITLYTQQVRALALVHALAVQHYLPDNAQIAVVGGGAGGVTAAAALAVTGTFRVFLFERADELMPLQRDASRRRIDPHLYDWPKEDASQISAELPLLDWQAGPAPDVRASVLSEFEEVKRALSARLDVLLRHDVKKVAPAKTGYEVTFDNEETRSDGASGADNTSCMRVDLVIFAFGFGMEAHHSLTNISTESYWSDAGVPGQEIAGKARPRFFISGSGDGALIDLVAAASANFDHRGTIEAIASQQGIREIAERLESIDVEARAAEDADQSFDFFEAYEKKIATDVARLGLVDAMVRRLRPGVQLVLQTRSATMMSVKTATLNRLAAYLVVKACDKCPAASFRHVKSATVASVESSGEDDHPNYLLRCASETIAADKVIVRRGPDQEKVRRPFQDMLVEFAAHHQEWVKRLGTAGIVPSLSDAARAHFKQLSVQHRLPLPRYLVATMAAQMPAKVQLRRVKGQVKWAGDLAPRDIGSVWDARARQMHLVCHATPEDLGPLAFAVSRLVVHAERPLLIAPVAKWKPLLARLTLESRHAEDIELPPLQAIGSEATALNPEFLELGDASGHLNSAMDTWVLNAIDGHLENYLNSARDPGSKVGFQAAATVRASMRVIWTEWRTNFAAKPALLNRFLRLAVCAVDADESDGEAQVLVGPRKLKSLIRATAVALAIASGWKAMTPHESRPGNLARRFGDQIHTGHTCAADMIGGESMALTAAKFMWRTHFVVLPLVTRPAGFTRLADSSLSQTEDSIPRLTDVQDRANVVLTFDEAFVAAVTQGTDAMATLLEQAETAHFARLNKGIERLQP